MGHIRLDNFNGEIVSELPGYIMADFKKCIRANRMNPFPKNTRVCAVVYLMKRGTIVRKFYGTNRPILPNEVRTILRYYPKNTIFAHAEYSALIDALKWMRWKGYKMKSFDIEMLVVRNRGNVPSRPCKYCRRFIKEKAGGVKVFYPLSSSLYAVEFI